jgi:hypothetical protein
VEYVDGSTIAQRFKGLTIPVMEYNEAIEYFRALMIESFQHGKSFGQHLKAEDYVRTILEDTYIYDMRKLIDIPDELLKDLRILAAHADKDVKTYLQDLIIEHIKKNKKK